MVLGYVLAPKVGYTHKLRFGEHFLNVMNSHFIVWEVSKLS